MGDIRQNRINLYSGLRLGRMAAPRQGPLAYENGDLVGVGKASTSSLLVQDTDTIYEVSQFQKETMKFDWSPMMLIQMFIWYLMAKIGSRLEKCCGIM